MTSNQLSYLNLQETGRNNRAVEAETFRSNLARETETNRSNLARETETNRSNLANERIKADTLAEQGRHNLITESQTDAQLAETKQHNRATEGADKSRIEETIRHDLATEKQAQYDTDTKASTSVKTAATAAGASKYGADKSAEAAKYGADKSAAASKYAADVKAVQDAAKRANDLRIASKNNKTKENIAQLESNTKKVLKEIDNLMNNANIKQKEKASLRQYKKDLIGIQASIAMGLSQSQYNLLGTIYSGLTRIGVRSK